MVDTSASVAFRCDASRDIGSGHVMRCLTLAEQLSLRGALISFLCSDETFEIMPTLRNSRYEKRPADSKLSADWLIVDHYGLDENYERDMRNHIPKILVIDDLANRPHDCDLLVDMTFGRKADDYNGLVPAHSKTLTGAEYALLRPEFAQIRKNLTRSFNGNNILVSFGGTNLKSVTEFCLTALQSYREKPLHIDVVTGANAKGLDEIRRIVALIEKEGHHTLTLHLDTPDIAALMAKADLCIGAGGTTSWERCCLGLPTLGIEIADNQSKILTELDRAGALKNLGMVENLTQDTLLEAFMTLLHNDTAVESMSRSAMTICDGLGAPRIAELIT